jgi:Fic family protein
MLRKDKWLSFLTVFFKRKDTIMNKRLGTYQVHTALGESFKAFIPPTLPPDPALNMHVLYPFLERATFALSKLNAQQKVVPNTALFLYMYVRKEALISSQIEGTQSSFADVILFEHDQKMSASIEDVEEVSNYVKAIQYGLLRLKENFPLSLRLLREMHSVLLSGGRGASKTPGEFRRVQNWIGGTRPGNALFVPPSVDNLHECLRNFEIFLHDTSLPVLIKAGLVHVQFESIHPFLDGNGRLGRLLIILLLCHEGMLDDPILYISLYLKQNRMLYYDLLQEVRTHGNWEAWLEFFLEGVAKTAEQATETILQVSTLFEEDQKKIMGLGRARFSAEKVFEYLKKMPQVTVLFLSQELQMSPPTIRSALNALVDLKIIEKITQKQRGKAYVYKAYLHLLEDGCQPLAP